MPWRAPLTPRPCANAPPSSLQESDDVYLQIGQLFRFLCAPACRLPLRIRCLNAKSFVDICTAVAAYSEVSTGGSLGTILPQLPEPDGVGLNARLRASTPAIFPILALYSIAKNKNHTPQALPPSQDTKSVRPSGRWSRNPWSHFRG